jgi:hypothetical protein
MAVALVLVPYRYLPTEPTKMYSRFRYSVWRSRDVYPGSRIRLFSIPGPGSRIRTVSIPDPGSSSENLSILAPKKAKKWFLSSKKYDPGCSSRIRMLTFSHPGSRIQGSKRHPIPDPGSGSATLQVLNLKKITSVVLCILLIVINGMVDISFLAVETVMCYCVICTVHRVTALEPDPGIRTADCGSGSGLILQFSSVAFKIEKI